FFRSLRVVGTTMGTLSQLHEVVAMMLTTGVRPVIDSRFDLDSADDVRSAFARLASGEVFGKVVLTRDECIDLTGVAPARPDNAGGAVRASTPGSSYGSGNEMVDGRGCQRVADRSGGSEMSERQQFKGRSAFIFAAMGAAICLGNIWRFP